VSAHKVGGPVGVGALVVSRTARLSPLLHGGAQQRRLSAGTQDVAGASAFAAAAEATVSELEAETERRRGLRDTLAAGILSSVDGAELLGDPIDRLPDNVHVHFPGAAGETLLFLLDTAGVSVSTGSACQAGVPEPSHVVQAMGRSAVEAREVLRFSLGRSTTVDDIDRVVSVLPGIVQRARAAR
jgi:cysteine desulfurase